MGNRIPYRSVLNAHLQVIIMTTSHQFLLPSIHEAHTHWTDEHRRWSSEARAWLHQVLVEEDHQFGYFCPSLREIKELLLVHLQAIQDHETALDERDFALHLHDVFDLEASERLIDLHRQAGKHHALQRHWHEALKSQVDGSLD